MATEIVSAGEDFVVKQLNRSFEGGPATTVLTVAGLDGTVTVGSANTKVVLTGTVTSGGKALSGTQNITGDVVATGDVSAATMHISTSETLTAVVAPGTPSAGTGVVYEDSTSKNLCIKDDAGTIKHGIQTQAGSTNKWVSAVTDAGAATVTALGAILLITVTAGHNGVGAVTLTGAKIGDVVAGVANLTTPADLKASFETTISVNDQIQQSSVTDLSGKQVQFIVVKQS